MGLEQKLVQGPVKITMNKVANFTEYILAVLNPQWNKVMGSMEDKDTLAPMVISHYILKKTDTEEELYIQPNY